MIDAGIVPKTSSEHLALITYLRLQAVQEKVLSEINDEMMGKWMNPFEYKKDGRVTEIENPEHIKKHAHQKAS